MAANGRASASAVIESDPDRRIRRIDKDQHSDNHSHQSSYAEHSESPDFDFGDKQSYGQQNQKNAHVIDRKKGKTEDRQQHADAADHSRRDKPGVGELEVQQDQPDNSQQQRQVRLGNCREQLFSRRHAVFDNFPALQVEHALLSRKGAHLVALQFAQKLRPRPWQ